MSKKANLRIDNNHPVKIGEGVYWVGVYGKSGAHSNPYLIVEDEEAVLIGGGSRLDFPSVMMNILQTAIIPSGIAALCYQNYNPSLCGSLAHLEAIINRSDLRIICHQANHMFIHHHSESSSLFSLEELDYRFEFSSGRRLDFISTPFAHSAGSFVIFDSKSGILFSGDLFSSYASHSNLIMKLRPICRKCLDFANCPEKSRLCPVYDIMRFHQNIMSSERALKYALELIAKIPFTTVAPQYGSVIRELEDILLVSERLSTLQGVGIDGMVGHKPFFEQGDISPLRKRIVSPEQCSTCK